jgi:hypothetical protein
LQQAGELEGAVGDQLRGLEDEAVPGGERLREHPQRDHDGEVERDDAGDHAERLVGDAAIDAAADVELFALGHVLEGEAELEALDAFEHVAAGLGEDLAVLVGDEPAELVEVALHQGLEAEQDLDALLERGVLPAGEGGRAAATAAATSAGPERATWPMTSAWRGLWTGRVSPEAAGSLCAGDPVGAGA